MSYEPRGKVKTLIDAMDADPSREWNTVAAAEVMQTTLSAVHAFVERAIAAGLLYRSLNNGRTVFSRKPFTEASCVSRLPEVPSTATGWKPPQMACTRPTAGTTASPARSHDTIDGLPAGAPRIYPDEPRDDALAKMAAAGAAREPIAAMVEAAASPAAPQITSVPRAAPVPAAASLPDVAAAEEDVEEFNAKVWLDGDVDLYGLIELEDGGHRIQAKDMARLRRLIAWMPA